MDWPECFYKPPPMKPIPAAADATESVASTSKAERNVATTSKSSPDVPKAIKEATSPSIRILPALSLNDWKRIFLSWTDAQRVTALNQLIGSSDLTELRFMMQAIEVQLQRDFLTNLPKELGLHILSFLQPQDLAKVAQTCKAWRTLTDDKVLWKKKCDEAGLQVIGPQSPKKVFKKQRNLELNWSHKRIRKPLSWKCHDNDVITCLLFKGNRILSGDSRGTLKIWCASTGLCLTTLEGHFGGIWCADMNETIAVSGSVDHTLRVWDLESGACIHTLEGHTSMVRCLILRGNLVVSGSRDNTLRIWDIDEEPDLTCFHLLRGHTDYVKCVQFDGKYVVSGSYDRSVRVWEAITGKCVHLLEGHTGRVCSLLFDSDRGLIISGGMDSSIRVWDITSGACKHTMHCDLALTMDLRLKIERNSVLLVSTNCTQNGSHSFINIWNLETGERVRSLGNLPPSTYGAHDSPFVGQHRATIMGLQLVHKFIVSASIDGTVKIWNLQTGAFIRNLVTLPGAGAGEWGRVWRIQASGTKLVCAVGSLNGASIPEETKLMVLDFAEPVECPPPPLLPANPKDFAPTEREMLLNIFGDSARDLV